MRPFKKKQKGRPVVLLYTAADGTRKEVVDKKNMEEAIITENKSRFLQSKNSPFLTSPLLDEVGILGNLPAADQILQGQYHNPNIPDITQQYIECLKMPPHVKTDESLKTFDINDHIKGWSRAKEKTAAEPHGLSFNHFKAASKHPDIAAFDYILREIPFRTGFSPKHDNKLRIYRYTRRIKNWMSKK